LKKHALGKPRKPLLLVVLALIISSNSASGQEKLHIAVASNFKDTLQSLVTLFQAYPHASKANVIVSSGSTGVLYAQITKGAPYDIFLSADSERPDRLLASGLALKSNRRVYARGQIALWAPNHLQAAGIELLSNRNSDSATRYTLANPKLAPYGLAAKVVMQKAGLWREADSARIQASNIAGAFQYIASSSVKLGWVAMSQLQAWKQKAPLPEQSYWLPELSDYPAIEQVAVQLARAKHPELASLFLAFLSAPEAQTLIKSYGYLVP